MFIEICVDGMDSALAAQRGGANRLELCSHLPAGGLTPSPGLLKQCKEKIKIPVYVMIRPRAGDFFYSEEEFETMKDDIKAIKQIGFEGVVFGILTNQNTVDLLRIKEIVSLARPMRITFHRAFDVCTEPFIALEQLIECGIDCILSSGQKNKAIDGVDLIKRLIKQAGSRIEILVGSGINDENIISIAQKTGATRFHLSAKKKVIKNQDNNDQKIQMGFEASFEESINIADEELIRKIKLLNL